MPDATGRPWPWLLLAAIAAAGLTLLPRVGLVPALRRRRVRKRRTRVDDALKHVHHALAEHGTPSIESVAGALHVRTDHASRLLADMERAHLVCQTPDGLDLTPAGRARALHVIRAHRLWEHHLAQETGFKAAEWHHRADKREHHITPDEADALSERLGHPTHDPHGDPIPTKGGHLATHGGIPLTAVPKGERCRIVHVEDEPQDRYDRLLDHGVWPGILVDVRDVTPGGYRVRVEGSAQTLAAMDAANVYVVPARDADAGAYDESVRLSSLRPGERGRVVRISSRCRGPERRRLVDLGVLPGTVIHVDLSSPFGDPVAYAVRGALIALRAAQADLIHVVPLLGDQP